ncbi:hypothetical protein BCR41DRAFT_388509 [Lobosporangium transversale]|uniref:Uncharacterized protein n=1 Tax=Lobosporangium transversale TaxID=64571 RepID=A0A1Y2GG05_9FUNG|nr:hypothetical protein BCR41DRAFT_388509 [Lobosporangium transversale]ORZ08789.1 hypothetical protein BCR41DRAFT_388509 [Lobosporangium transversale]|eukprot:XP_021878572.1 hypothetical protein BCR41DRAFT_388509 [Lobosporangium transversale]
MALFSSQWASTLVELPTLTFHQALLPLSVFSALHGIRVAMAYRKAIEQAAEQSLNDDSTAKSTRVPFGQALFSVLVMCLGGGFTASMLLGMPPSWLGSNVVVPTYTLSFVLVQYTALYEILNEMIPPAVLDSILIIADGSLRALSIAKTGVDGSRMRFAADSHQSGAGSITEPWFAMLLLGTIAGSGGGMWADLLRLKTHHWCLSTPSFVHAATYDMKAALLSALFYATSTSPQFYNLLHGDNYGSILGKGGLLEEQDGKAMTMLVMCTLMLGQRAEPAIFQWTGYSISPAKWARSIRINTTTAARKKHDEDHSSEESGSVNLKKLDQKGEPTHRLRRRQGVLAEEHLDDEDEEHEDEEEDVNVKEESEEEEPVKKTARGKRKSSTTKKQASSEASSTTKTTRSTRARKPVYKDL